jgi:hypothetical protein
MDGVADKASGTESGELCVLQLQFGLRALEEAFVLGVGTRPAALDVIDSEIVEFRRNEQLVVYGERDGLALSAVAEGGIEGMDFHYLK